MYTINYTTHEGEWNIVCADGCWALHECAAGSGIPSPHTHCDELQSQRPVNPRHGVVVPNELSLSLPATALRRKHHVASHSRARKLEFAHVKSCADGKIIRRDSLAINLKLDLDAGGGILIGLSGE